MSLTAIFAKHHLKYDMYADDTQLYVEYPRNQPCDADIVTRRIEAYTTDIKRWMTSQQLLLNETKPETIVFYGRNARVPPAVTTVDVHGCHITPQPTQYGTSAFSGTAEWTCRSKLRVHVRLPTSKLMHAKQSSTV